ncbi:(2Fe-2S)-binding protein [Litoribacillus peritrichatus]|uniref:(2Fe-2S)-binding protein n=1 Tax=Litoribacillus peritrichatus TaxID=718191 RepID=A0ABP7M597_9GAMM
MIEFRVNGNTQRLDVEGDTPLLWVLRDTIGLTGTKFGCGMGLCGACTVQMNGQPIRSCSMPVSAIHGQEITTIEGVGTMDDLHPVQQAWIDENVPQCGYCQSGQIMSATALLASNPNPSDDEIKQYMAGNICRCGTYPRIQKAIKKASRAMQRTGFAESSPNLNYELATEVQS